MALIAWFWLPDEPASAWFLSKDERQFAKMRIIKDNIDSVTLDADDDGVAHSRLSKRDVSDALMDWKTWYVLVFNVCASVPNQTFSVFLPLVVQGLGYSSIQANLVSMQEMVFRSNMLIQWLQMSVPPYVCGAVGLYLFALSSDHRCVASHPYT